MWLQRAASMKSQRKYPPFETRSRIKKYCDMQERAHTDVVSKLYDWGLYRDEIDQIVAELISENYLNEERFARAYARGKFRIKNWGWRKIEMGLKQKSVSAHCIKLARQEIDPHEYVEVLKAVIAKKRRSVSGRSEWEKNQKLLRFAVGRGFEPNEVLEILSQTDGI